MDINQLQGVDVFAAGRRGRCDALNRPRNGRAGLRPGQCVPWAPGGAVGRPVGAYDVAVRVYLAPSVANVGVLWKRWSGLTGPAGVASDATGHGGPIVVR